jgi:hypothetical protein
MLHQMSGEMGCAPKACQSFVECRESGVDVSGANGQVVDATFVSYEKSMYVWPCYDPEK